MSHRVSIALVAGSALLPLLIALGCDRRGNAGPPPLRVGRDECVECGMLISEDRCASAAEVEAGGRSSFVLFDDLGCQIAWEKGDPSRRVIASFACDWSKRGWIDASTALYLRSDPDRLRTPMGFGVVAFADRADAERAQGEFGGEILSVEEARRALANPPSFLTPPPVPAAPDER